PRQVGRVDKAPLYFDLVNGARECRRAVIFQEVRRPMPMPYAYLRGEIIPLAEAKIGIMTHAFNYGTGVFEGIRGNWNADNETMYLFRVEDHCRRIKASGKIMQIEIKHSVAEIANLVEKLITMSGFREDVYIRPMAYKSSEVVGVRMHDLEDDLLIFATPFGAYLDTEK